jgi:hypothetical protein
VDYVVLDTAEKANLRRYSPGTASSSARRESTSSTSFSGGSAMAKLAYPGRRF